MSRTKPIGRERGSTSVQILVILVPVFFGFMGFAIDLGRMYLVRGELKAAANAMALAAAARLAGTDASIEAATASARLVIENTGGYASKYDFGNVVIGEGTGRLTSAMPEPSFYETVAGATGEGEGVLTEAGSATARHVRVDITADAPLIFWSFLSLGQERRTPIAVRAVAGISAPLCTACGIEPIAIAPLNPEDTTHFGFTLNERYTFGYFCTGVPQPSGLQGATQRVPYMLLNRYNEEATLFPEETSQLFRIGAGGLPPSTNPARSCVAVNAQETGWVSVQPLPCQQNRVPAGVTAFACGLATRLDTTLSSQCETITEAATIVTAYTADPDTTNLDYYAAYTGNFRRVLTVVVVDTLSPAGTLTVLGFRQFLIQPDQNATTISPGDSNARFVATYIGSPVPLRQGSFSGCTLTAGPGKVVLHQ